MFTKCTPKVKTRVDSSLNGSISLRAITQTVKKELPDRNTLYQSFNIRLGWFDTNISLHEYVQVSLQIFDNVW